MIEEIREYCFKKENVSEDFPFDNETLCLRVSNKIFALIATEKTPISINLKCDPEYAIELRENHDWIIPGYHMNKKHWNTIIFQDQANPELIFKLIDHSYDLVSKTIKRR